MRVKVVHHRCDDYVDIVITGITVACRLLQRYIDFWNAVLEEIARYHVHTTLLERPRPAGLCPGHIVGDGHGTLRRSSMVYFFMRGGCSIAFRRICSGTAIGR